MSAVVIVEPLPRSQTVPSLARPAGEPLSPGDRLGRLVILDEAKPYVWRGRVARRRWVCLCDCGRETVARDDVLKSGHTKSCGCFRDDVTRERTTKHGARAKQSRRPEYDLWRTLIRNHAPAQVPQRWTATDGTGFRNFVHDVGRRPSPRHQLARTDVRGPFSAENCRWRVTQQRDGVPRRLIVVSGQKMTLREAAKVHDIEYRVLCKRLQRGWSIDRALQFRSQSRSQAT